MCDSKTKVVNVGRDAGGKLDKVETLKPEHPETTEKTEEKEVHVNHVEAFNSAIARSYSQISQVKSPAFWEKRIFSR